jgi:hypothetical protein
MNYGTIKVDQITFTNAGVDDTLTVSGIMQSMSGSMTVTGTVQGETIIGTSTVSGATVTGNIGQFTVITGGSAGFTTITGNTVTGTAANFVSGVFSAEVSGLTVRGTTVSGATVTGNVGSFATLTGGVITLTSGVFGAGTAALPSISFSGDLNTGIYSPGADQVSISTNGTGRLFVDSTGQVRLTNGNVFTASDNTGFLALYGGGAFNGGAGIILYGSANATEANVIRFVNGSFSERARIDSSGRLLVGTSTSVFGSTVQAVSTGGAQYEGARFSADAFGPAITLIKSRGASVGTNTAVQNDDVLGSIAFRGANGSDYSNVGAQIIAVVDGEPFTSGDTTDLPTRLVFFTCPDGASSPTERFRITNDGVIAHDQPAPAAVNATATLTIANLKAGIITSTSAAATDMTLPTGTDTQAGFSGTYDNFTFEWSVINTGPSLVRVLAGTAHTVVGSGSVATGTSGRFASRRTAANTFVTYRLS